MLPTRLRRFRALSFSVRRMEELSVRSFCDHSVADSVALCALCDLTLCHRFERLTLLLLRPFNHINRANRLLIHLGDVVVSHPGGFSEGFSAEPLFGSSGSLWERFLAAYVRVVT